MSDCIWKVKVYKVKDELFVNRFLGKLHRGELAAAPRYLSKNTYIVK
jgi:hypothetical protein